MDIIKLVLIVGVVIEALTASDTKTDTSDSDTDDAPIFMSPIVEAYGDAYVDTETLKPESKSCQSYDQLCDEIHRNAIETSHIREYMLLNQPDLVSQIRGDIPPDFLAQLDAGLQEIPEEPVIAQMTKELEVAENLPELLASDLTMTAIKVEYFVHLLGEKVKALTASCLGTRNPLGCIVHLTRVKEQFLMRNLESACCQIVAVETIIDRLQLRLRHLQRAAQVDGFGSAIPSTPDKSYLTGCVDKIKQRLGIIKTHHKSEEEIDIGTVTSVYGVAASFDSEIDIKFVPDISSVYDDFKVLSFCGNFYRGLYDGVTDMSDIQAYIADNLPNLKRKLEDDLQKIDEQQELNPEIIEANLHGMLEILESSKGDISLAQIILAQNIKEIERRAGALADFHLNSMGILSLIGHLASVNYRFLAPLAVQISDQVSEIQSAIGRLMLKAVPTDEPSSVAVPSAASSQRALFSVDEGRPAMIAMEEILEQLGIIIAHQALISSNP